MIIRIADRRLAMALVYRRLATSTTTDREEVTDVVYAYISQKSATEHVHRRG